MYLLEVSLLTYYIAGKHLHNSQSTYLRHIYSCALHDPLLSCSNCLFAQLFTSHHCLCYWWWHVRSKRETAPWSHRIYDHLFCDNEWWLQWAEALVWRLLFLIIGVWFPHSPSYFYLMMVVAAENNSTPQISKPKFSRKGILLYVFLICY